MAGSLRDRVAPIGRAISEHILEPEVDVTETEIRIPDLPLTLQDFLIAQISDLHVGEGDWRPLHLGVAARAVREAQPDVVINTGDYVWKSPPLHAATATAGHFVLSDTPNLTVLGNHDYYLPPEKSEELACGLEALGMQVLTNRAICLQHEGAGISFIGLSVDAHQGTFEQGIAALLAAGRPRIALVHEPGVAELLPHESADLVLAGHTHGGQVALPFLTPQIVYHFAGSRYVEGTYRVNGMPLYVNRGLGFVGVPLRFRAAPEVSLIRLTR